MHERAGRLAELDQLPGFDFLEPQVFVSDGKPKKDDEEPEESRRHDPRDNDELYSLGEETLSEVLDPDVIGSVY